jgi:NADPH-dependent 2,4-dienoyl-CoA reductase/sulfur reductase-like enzyme
MLVGNETTPPYHRPLLFKSFLGKTATPVEKVLCLEPAWYQKNNVDLRLDTLVTQFNIDRRVAVLGNGQAVEFRKALLATGSRARRPQLAGATLGNVFYLRSIRDVLALREIAELERHVVIVGGGFIGVETAALLAQNSRLNVTLLHRGAAVWNRLVDPETASFVTEHLASRGVKMLMGETLNGFEGRTVLKNVQTKSGHRFSSGLAIVAVGSDPNLALVANTPLSYPNGAPVNEFLESDEKGIFAAGDIALYPSKVFGGVRRTDHWDCAITQGRIAGANMTGKKRIKFDYIPSYTSTVGDLQFDFVGDFTKPPTRVEVEGDRAKKKFIVRCFQLNALNGVVLCNQSTEKLEAAKVQLRGWPRGKKAAQE